MRAFKVLTFLSVVALSSTVTLGQDSTPSKKMSFFLTSVNPGQGGDLGGIAGADRHCKALATAARAPKRNWRAYLSAASVGKQSAIHARDRIGRGPWYNYKGEMVARNLDDLHGAAPTFQKATVLTERGLVVNGRGDTPNRHDILTGSGADGRLAIGEGDLTCSNWTSSAATGKAMVGHHDRQGGGAAGTSLGAAHPSRGCGIPELRASGGDGLIYCFAK